MELPLTAVKIVHFPDEHPRAQRTDGEQPPYTPNVMQPFYDDLVPAIPLVDYRTTQESQSRLFSHSVHGFWSHMLDYLFASPRSSWVPGRSDVLQSRGHQGVTLDPNE